MRASKNGHDERDDEVATGELDPKMRQLAKVEPCP
jgi:hypothetical protein